MKQTSFRTCWCFSLHVETTSLAANQTFTGNGPLWRPRAGKGYYGDLEHHFAWLLSIPYGSVEGTLTYDGQKHPVRGNGYHINTELDLKIDLDNLHDSECGPALDEIMLLR